jgi:hypothetical protein
MRASVGIFAAVWRATSPIDSDFATTATKVIAWDRTGASEAEGRAAIPLALRCSSGEFRESLIGSKPKGWLSSW